MIIKYENGEIYDSDSLSKDEKKSDLCVFTILENIANSKKIRSDISKLKKQEKIFEAYSIPANEKLVAYLKKSIFGLTTDGTIFTDKAMYVYPKNTTHKPMEGEFFSSNRIPYTEFCDYIITHKHDKAGVFLNNTIGKYSVCDKTMFGINKIGEELYTVIKALQSILCNTDLDAWNKREYLIEKFFELSNNDIRIGELSSNFQEVIESLLNDKSYFDKAIYVLAKNSFRLCNKSRYSEFIEKYKGCMSQETKKKLEDAPNEFIYELLDDLSNIKLEFKREYIEKVYKHLIHVCANNKDDVYKVREYMQIFFFVCMRNNQHILGRRLIKDYISIYGKSSSNLLQDFACIYGNKQMKKVFDILKTGKELDKEYYKVVDGIGLTPLHYALIMNLPEYISILANSDCYDNDFLYISNNNSISKFYYYTALNVICDINNNDIYLHTDSELRSYIEDHDTLNDQLLSARDEIINTRNLIRDAERRYANAERDGEFEAASNYKYCIEDLESALRSLETMWHETYEKVDELWKMVSSKKESVINEAKQIAEDIKNETNPFIEFLLKIYENSDIVISQIVADVNENSEIKIYEYMDFTFALPASIKLNLPYRKICIDSSGIKYEDYVTTRKYMRGWFSKEAYSDENLLKTEYRALVKQFHPDIYEGENSENIFNEIHSEYEMILQKIRSKDE